MQLVITATTACNLNCRHCIVDKEHPRNLDMSVIDRLATWDVSRVGILGGEPFVMKNINGIVEKFSDKPVTIYTNGILLSENPDKIIDGVHYAVSMDGLKEFHEYYRGKGTWDKTYHALELLADKKDAGDILSVWIRMTISEGNIKDMKPIQKIAESLGIGVLYFPLLGIRKPMPSKLQLEIFKWASTQDNVSLYSPAFWQFCGYEKSSCQAGKWRLHVDEFGNVTPCQWIRDHTFGHALSHDYEYFKQRGEEYYRDFVTVKPECKDCLRSMSCKGGCRFSPDSLTCPIKLRYFAQNILSIDDLRLANTKHERMFGNLKIVVC